jgi:serine protease Do
MIRRAPLVLGFLLSLSGVALAAPPAPPLPSLPGANGGGGTTAPVPTDGAAGNGKVIHLDFDTLRKGVVQVEQAGRPMAVGTVLQKDGRILTSLSALGGVENPEIRYSDNTVVKTKIGHKDKGWDLALLIPQSGKWMEGLMPTDVDPSGVDIKAFLPKAGKLGSVPIALKGRTDVRTREGDPLKSVLDLDLKGLPGIPGAPLLNPDGKVVGILVKACKEIPESADKGGASAAAAAAGVDKNAVCAPVTIGAPVAALRGFLMKTPATAIQPAAWLGLGGAPTESGNVKGVRVMGVAPGSPAEKAGLKAAGDNPDTIVAVDGTPVETPEQLADVIGKRAIGQTVKLLVFSQGKFREAVVTLRAAP